MRTFFKGRTDPAFLHVPLRDHALFRHRQLLELLEREAELGFSWVTAYLVQELVQGAIGHELCDDAEELGLVADAEDLDDVVEPGLVEHLGLFQ